MLILFRDNHCPREHVLYPPREHVLYPPDITIIFSSGKALLRHMEIDEVLKDPATEEEIPKSTFIVYFQGEQLKMRVKKICEG